MMMKARYIGDGPFRYGDKLLVKGDTIDSPPALVDALLTRADFIAEGGTKKKTKNAAEDDTPVAIEILTED